MSDTDSELLTTNRVFSFQNEITTVSARGPNINTSNLTGLSFRNNVLTSTMNMPRNYEWQRLAESNNDQRSMGYRRETSPMSIVSACDARQRNFNSSYYGRGMSSHRTVYNGRSGSPMSMRSMDSNATMCASEIVMALKNTQFSKYDMRMIKEAYNKLIKHKVRKRIEKRRNLKLFLKGYRRKSGYDSGELGSNSSMSSDDNKSTRTLNHKNMSSCRSTKTDVADFKRTIKDSDMFTDCSDNFRQSRMHSRIGRPANMNTSGSSVSSFRSMIEKPITKLMNPINFNKTQSQSSTLQDRFKNGFLLPSQRFNKSVAASSIPETVEKPTQINKHQNVKANREHVRSSSSQETSDEEIFPNVTTIERPPVNRKKRSYDDDICLPVQKRPKVASPCKNMQQSFKNSTVMEKAKNDFEFAKPAFPVRKSANQKAKEKILSKSDIFNAKEELISKSRAPLSDSIIQPLQVNPQPKLVEETEPVLIDKTEESTINQNTTDLSMRPSFIKRKLFTQRMDVTEKTNDVANSPQNSVYGAIQKEKNKARKLVTSQYCLSRDIQSDENNLLDLIHKIVPAERMNATNQTNKTAVNNKSEDNDDKWDVTSIISTRNKDEDVSDTFTDEDTLLDEKGQPSPKGTEKKKKKSPLKKPEKMVKKSPLKATQNTQKVLVEKNGTPKTSVQKYVKSFWDTDFESDAEGTPARREEFKENKKTENAVSNASSKVKFQSFSSMFPAKMTTVAKNASMMNSTVDTTQKFNNTNKSFKLFTHRNNKSNVKKNMHESFKEDAKSIIEPQSKKQKVNKANSCLDLSKQGNIGKSMQENNQKTKLETKKTPPKQRKTRETPEIKEKEPVKKQNNKQDKVKSDVKLMQQHNKTDSEQSKSDKKKKETLIDQKPKGSKKSTKNKSEIETKDEKQHKKSDVNTKQNINIQNKKTKDQKATTQLNTTLNNNKKNTKGKVSKLPDSIIYEDSFTETNNNKSIRPIRSCRNAKQNATLNTSKANNTINRSLRSRDITLTTDHGLTKEVEKKTAAKNSKKTTKNEQSVLSDLSFSLAQDKKTKKPVSSYNSRIFKSQEIDTSDVSFSLNDKESPKKYQGNSAKPCMNMSFLKKAIVNLTSKNLLLSKQLIDQRPTRNRLANRRYIT